MSKIILAIIAVVILAAVALGAYLMLAGSGNIPPKTGNPDENTNGDNANITMIQGMKVETVQEGSGEPAKNGDTVTVHYTGTLTNGTKFDSSFDIAAPFTFALGQGKVIPGWDLGVVGMKVGEKRKLTIPPDLGYGPNGFPPAIPKNAVLMFDVEMLKIN